MARLNPIIADATKCLTGDFLKFVFEQIRVAIRIVSHSLISFTGLELNPMNSVTSWSEYYWMASTRPSEKVYFTQNPFEF